MGGRGVTPWEWVRSATWLPAGTAGSSPGHAAVAPALLCWCGLPSANVTHFPATQSPGSTLPTAFFSLPAHSPTPESHWAVTVGRERGCYLQVV